MNDAPSSAGGPEPIAFDRLAPRPGYRLAVVGANGGIGTALVARAAVVGIEIFSFDTAQAMAERPLAATARSCSIDVRNAQSVADAFAQIGGAAGTIDGFVYVSGVGSKPGPMLSATEDDWDRTLDINLRGAFLTAKAVAPLLRRPGGAMLFISSGLAINVEAGFAAYTSSKAGLLGLMKVLAKELAPDIRVNAVAPGLVDTPFLAGGTGQGVASGRVGANLDDWFGKERAQAMRDAIPMRRVAEPDDIVAPILFLLGPGARFVTGQTLHVNGGRFLP
ncbi:MAG: SDR family oxidoreductase [Xanthobacteraceae bacterium]